MGTVRTNSRRLRATAAGALLVVVSCALAAGMVEVAFRLMPGLLLPAGAYGAGVRHPQLNMNVHGQRLLYKKGNFIERMPNSEGFLDIEHSLTKPEGTVRVGFFGDSYVESGQIPLESVFFRRLAHRMSGKVETLGFGISGWGTLQAARAYDTLAPRYDLDIAVYLFVENDPGNNWIDLSRQTGEAGSGMPYAELRSDGNSYEVGWIVEPGRETWWHGAGKWLQRHSLLAHVVQDRISKLATYGVQLRSSKAAKQMSDRSGSVPSVNDLPSTWPREYRDRAERLGELILRDWRDAAAARHTYFMVFYVPRGEDQLLGTLSVEDTWLPWLRAVCDRHGIPLVDPSESLGRALEEGHHVYGDHWSPEGHEVVSEVLAQTLSPVIDESIPHGER